MKSYSVLSKMPGAIVGLEKSWIRIKKELGVLIHGEMILAWQRQLMAFSI